MRLSISSRPFWSISSIASALSAHIGGDAAVVPDLRIITHAAEQVVGDARRAPAAPGDFVRALAVNLHVQQMRRADDDFLQVCGHVIIEPLAQGKARWSSGAVSNPLRWSRR